MRRFIKIDLHVGEEASRVLLLQQQNLEHNNHGNNSIIFDCGERSLIKLHIEHSWAFRS